MLRRAGCSIARLLNLLPTDTLQDAEGTEMHTVSNYFCIGLSGVLLTGCAATQQNSTLVGHSSAAPVPTPAVAQVAYSESEVETNDGEELASPMVLDETIAVPIEPTSEPVFSDTGLELDLPELIRLTLEQNPRLAQYSWAIQAARGRAIQAGLYPNPTFSVTGNEISDRTGPVGIWSAFAGQEIVTANKLGLSTAAAQREVNQANLKLIAERYRVMTEVRQAYFEAVMLQRRAEILEGLLKLAEQTVNNADKLYQAGEAAELDVVQLEVDLERYRADLESTQQALPGAYKKIAARMGVEDLHITRLAGDLDWPLPDYDLEQLRTYVLSIHPEIRSAQIGIDRARFLLRRAEVQPIPNVTVGTGYTYQGQNRSSDWDIGVSLPVPVWNKNQGNILEAQSQVNQAIREVQTVENSLVNQLATAFSAYASARKRVEKYNTAIIPKAQQSYEMSFKAFQGGEFEYLRVLQAQRSVAEANLELVRSLGAMWQDASVIAGLMLEDQWPLRPDLLDTERNEL